LSIPISLSLSLSLTLSLSLSLLSPPPPPPPSVDTCLKAYSSVGTISCVFHCPTHKSHPHYHANYFILKKADKARQIQVLEGGQLLLRSLDLSINTVSDRAGTALGSALANNSLLNTLHLDKTGLTQVRLLVI
jgi:hypothetical protein